MESSLAMLTAIELRLIRNLRLTDRTHRTRQLFGSECEGSVLKLGNKGLHPRVV